MSKTITVIGKVRFSARHKPTHKTTHRSSSGEEVPPPAELRIVQYAGDPGFLLIHFDGDLNEITDTYHSSLDGALEQAKWEFDIDSAEWEGIR